MGNLTIATIFVVMLNIMMWFSGLAMEQVNPGMNMCYHVEGSLIESNVNSVGSFDGNQSVLAADVMSDLPTSESTTVSPTSTSFTFVDVFSSVLSWVKGIPGVRYVYSVVAAPMNILTCMGLPNEFGIGLGVLWYMVSLLILVAFLFGRD